MAKDIKIVHSGSNNNFADMYFLHAFDDSPYSLIFESARSDYKLYHPSLKDDYSVDLDIKSNFYHADAQIQSRLSMKKPSFDKMVGYATEAMIYKQILHYHSSGIGFGNTKEQDETNPDVEKFKIHLDEIITQGKNICTSKVIEDIGFFVSKKFKSRKEIQTVD